MENELSLRQSIFAFILILVLFLLAARLENLYG